MKKLFIFAIGGTGERVLRATTMLFAAGVPTFDNYEVYPIIIDYDANNADKLRTVRLLQNYAALHAAAFQRHTTGSNDQGLSQQFFAAKMCNLKGLDNYVFPLGQGHSQQKTTVKFREHIGYDTLAGNTLRTRELLSSLYDESNRADTELNLNMDVGFKGNPNIGSVVFHDINSDPSFINFLQLYQPQQGDKVVVIGSLFGGTGASGIPEIVKAIDAKVQNAKIATLLVLPYFDPMSSNSNDAIQSSRFASKTKAALSFYNDAQLLDKIDKVYYVGDPYRTQIPYCDGGNKQENKANLVELLAAMMIEHYVAGRDQKTKEFSFAPEANIVVQQGVKSGQRLFVSDFDPTSTDVILQPLLRLGIALKVFHDEICTKNASARDFYKILALGNALSAGNGVSDGSAYPLRNLCKELQAYYEEYHAWYTELDYEGDGGTTPANAHRFALCNMKADYPNILLKDVETQTTPQGNLVDKVGGIFTSNKSKLSANFLLTRMNVHVTSHYDPQSKNGKALLPDREEEWVLADILYRAAKDGYDKLTK